MEPSRDPPVSDNVKEPETGSFRLQARHVALTYAQCDLSKEEVRETLMKRSPTHMIIAQEHHKDGGLHLHVYLHREKKFDTKNKRYFDIKGFHPNIKKCYNQTGWINYLKKEDLNPDISFNFDAFDSKNFVRRKNDFEAFKNYHESRALVGKVPSMFVFKDKEIRIDMEAKKRNVWIVGDPSIGKSEAIVDFIVDNKLSYLVITDDRYPFDNYEDQRVVWWDDTFPKRKDLIACSNKHRIKVCVGPTRYTSKFWEQNVNRLIFVTTNNIPDYWDDEAFIERFHRIDVRSAHSSSGQAPLDWYNSIL